MSDHVHHTVIVGAGFAGIGAAVRLLEDGQRDLVVLERGPGVGGTWRDNDYPGAACDVPSTLYSYSFAPNPQWSRAFAPQAEILAYLRAVADERGATPHVRTGVDVQACRWEERDLAWTIETDRGTWRARALVVGAGPFSEPQVPDLDGFDDFAGTAFHSARWNHDHDLTGRHVAVVGAGASAIQIIPAIQPRVARLYALQRTPQWVLPRVGDRIPAPVQRLFARRPGTQRAARRVVAGGFEAIGFGSRHPSVMRSLEVGARLHLRRAVRDPHLRASVTPDFTLGCKRMLLSDRYYRSLATDNVEVVRGAVGRVEAGGVVAGDGVARPVDTIIFATGFQVADHPMATRIVGRDGTSLATGWKGTPTAYLGTTVHGFPNLFVLLGPNVSAQTSAIELIEAQLDYIVPALRRLGPGGVTSLDVRADVQDAFNREVQAAMAGTVWTTGGCTSYFLDAGGVNHLLWPWSTAELRRRTATFDLSDYEVQGAGR